MLRKNIIIFEVAYLPVPSGYARDDISDYIQTYLPRLAPILSSAPTLLRADAVCCITRNMIAVDPQPGLPDYNLFAAQVSSDANVFGISTFNLREYAREAGAPFEKTVLLICLSMVLQVRWRIIPHKETFGCLFDLLMNRDDIVIALKKMRFDHQECRRRSVTEMNCRRSTLSWHFK